VPEDHLYDYSFPGEPWENVGNSAQLYGAGTLLLALGILARALGVISLPRSDGRRGVAAIVRIIEILIAILIAGSFVPYGAHALISGVTDTPSPLLRAYGAIGWVAVIGLPLLIVRWAFKSPAAIMACVFLVGTTGLGYYIATFHIAPILAGYVSHDTTPWTETVVAVWTAAAGFAMILAAADAAGRRARVVAKPAADAVVEERQ
jgi:hypothetical protein